MPRPLGVALWTSFWAAGSSLAARRVPPQMPFCRIRFSTPRPAEVRVLVQVTRHLGGELSSSVIRLPKLARSAATSLDGLMAELGPANVQPVSWLHLSLP